MLPHHLDPPSHLARLRRYARGGTLVNLLRLPPALKSGGEVYVFMLALLGGRQRTRGEYAALLEAAGLALEQEIDTRAGISILETRPR